MEHIIAALRVINGTSAPAEQSCSLADAIIKLDQYAADPALPIDARLRHYLQQRSYQKALLYCTEGRFSPASCAPKS
jgi:hypothetical protein